MANRVKTACVLRIGGIGDLALASPLFRLLSEDGYHVTVITKGTTYPVLKGNPYIDKYQKWKWGELNESQLKTLMESLSKKYDKFINLSGSIEGNLLAIEGSPEAELSKGERHRRYNRNYAEETLRIAGYEDKKSYSAEIYLTKTEERAGKNLRANTKGKLVMWVLSGSSFHKTYPYSEIVMKELIDEHSDLNFVTVGDSFCHMIEPHYERCLNRSGIWNLRRSIIMAKYVDLVVTTDTGLAHVAAAFKTPMIVILSNISIENLTKHWENCTVIEPDVSCYPCHRLIYTLNYCKRDTVWNSPICISKIPKEQVKETIKEKLYAL